MLVIDDKKRLRAEAAARRAEAHGAAARDTADAVCANVIAAWGEMRGPAPGAVVSGYWPMGNELDVRPLLHNLDVLGYACALPAAVALDEPLEFRRWQPGMILEAGVRGTWHPPGGATRVTPQIVLVPLLAFDAGGFRLGYGAGFYDRALASLRAAAPVLAIGIAFAAQRVDRVPRAEHDEPLDWVVTEAGAIRMT